MRVRDVKMYWICGDYCNDGHGRYEQFTMRTNMPDDLQRIEEKVNEKLGFKFNEICREYEQSQPFEEEVTKLKAAGFDIMDPKKPYGEDTIEPYVSAETLFNLWIDLMKWAEPELELEVVNDITQTHDFGGGYGVFY